MVVLLENSCCLVNVGGIDFAVGILWGLFSMAPKKRNIGRQFRKCMLKRRKLDFCSSSESKLSAFQYNVSELY